MGNFLAGVLGVKSEYEPNGIFFGAGEYQKELDRLGHIYGAQNVLQQQLAQQAAGGGPTPEQIQYAQNVQRGIAGAQGLIASQRGLNPALAARMGSNIAASQNAQAAAQSAILGQTRQLAAQERLAGLLGTQAAQAMKQQELMTQTNVPTMQTQAAIAHANQQAAQGIVGGIMSGFGSTMGLAKAHGGEIPKYQDGGVVMPEMEILGTRSKPEETKSEAAQYLSAEKPADGMFGADFGTMGTKTGFENVSPVLAQGFGEMGVLGANPALSRGISGLFPNLGSSLDAAKAALPMMAAKGGAINFKPGGYVPGKAKVKGDSEVNDTVPAMVSPGEIVIPRSIAQGKDAAKKSADFVAAVLAKKGRRA